MEICWLKINFLYTPCFYVSTFAGIVGVASSPLFPSNNFIGFLGCPSAKSNLQSSLALSLIMTSTPLHLNLYKTSLCSADPLHVVLEELYSEIPHNIFT